MDNITIVVLFCNDLEVVDIEWLSDNTNDLSSADLIILAVNASDSVLIQLNHKSNHDIVEINDTFIPAAFFKAKEVIDSKKCLFVKLVCSQVLATLIEKLCNELLPPVFTWDIVVTPGSKRHDPPQHGITSNNIDIALFLKSLPGDGDIHILRSELIPKDVFYHGFSTRTGGISKAPGLRSMNLVYSNAKQDSHAVITENRRRLAEQAGFDSTGLIVARGFHGNTVHVIGKEEPKRGYDGIVTNQPGYTCAAPGADCIDMVFADPVKKACGTIHSGWKGTLEQICIEILNKMKESFGCRPEDILVVMGPSVCEKCYEFGVEDSKPFVEMSPECVLYSGIGKPTIDLKLANRILLEANGVKPEHIDDKTTALCTMENPGLLFSYRRDGRPFGTQIGFIGIKETENDTFE